MSEQEVVRLEEQVKTLFNEIKCIKDDLKEIKYQLSNRLPLWATMMVAFLTGIIGWLISGAI